MLGQIKPTKAITSAPLTPVPDGMIQTKAANPNQKNHTVWFWVGLFVVFVGYGWIQHRNEKAKEAIKPSNLAANLHNVFLITVAAVIGIVAGKIFLTKLVGLTARIPVVNRAVAYLAELFSAA